MGMTLHCFGASSLLGAALHHLCDQHLVGYSRNPPLTPGWIHHADLSEPSDFHPAGYPNVPSIWISFAPIWLFAPFLETLIKNHPDRLQDVRGVIACSSSSTITKRFAANRFDRELFERLTRAEDSLLETCRMLDVPCRILRPTLIYGKYGSFCDRNLSRLLVMLRSLPLIPLPAETGLRQPIHASQLAAVSLHLAKALYGDGLDDSLPERIALGGDTTLTYADIFRTIQNAQPSGDPARRCYFLIIPNRLYFLLAAPLLLRSPKAYEAVLRMGSNLSGFIPAHEILGSQVQPFPVSPLS